LGSNAEGSLTTARARELLAAGFAALEERKQEINDLNVYPVPDGDTGTNLSLTVRGMAESLSKLPEDLSGREVCSAISQAALMGARGNSGVILSQIVRGAMEVLGQDGPITQDVLTRALRHATDTAYRAVRKPVEGTMLTVLREMAEAAAQASEAADMSQFLGQVVAAGWKSVEKTPTLLKVLADAGVVDAGGFGLVVLIEGAADGHAGAKTVIATHFTQPVAAAPVPAEEFEEEDSQYTYCTSFLLSGHGLDKDSLEEKLGRFGDSLLVVGDHTQIKVHVHTDEPGTVIGMAGALGVLTEIEIDNMNEQKAARTKRLAQRAEAQPPIDAGLTQVVAVVAGEGNKALFRNLGVDLIVEGGQSMNPSTEDIMRAVEKAAAPSVIILPNNGNVIMTADQTVSLTDREVFVVPSRSIQAGLSAAVAFDKRRPGAGNAKEMRAALEGVSTAEITRAVRDSLVDGVQVKAADFIGLIDDKVVVAGAELEPVVDDVVARLLDGGRGLLTALIGAEESADRAAAALEKLRAKYPLVDIDLHEGGQPFYPVLLSAE
jgi:DAK2 domain fusion protein YloV